jgi:hypothetical protein
MRAPRVLLTCFAACLAAAFTVPVASASGNTPSSGTTVPGRPHIDCSQNHSMCTEVGDSEEVFGEGHYVGHDEPSLLFYSNRPGSGNRMQYEGVIPTDPPAQPVIGKRSYNFQLFATIWYGMVLCDTQSYPEQRTTCTPDSDSNVVPAGVADRPGAAYMELQFYPPGYVRQFDGFSCSATKWCVAMTIDSLSENPVTGQLLNDTCAATVGVEPVNFAYLTHSGKSQAAANPVQFDPVAAGKPDPSKALFLSPGDHYTTTLHDTAHGLQAVVSDLTTGQSGSMTASAANGFGQVKFLPNPSKKCVNIPYDFHPMYSSASPSGILPWGAAQYNIAIDTEIGHFDYCSTTPKPFGSCTGEEDTFTTGHHPADVDDNYCFPARMSTRVKVNGCLDSNTGFDGTSYLPDWPNGNTTWRPGPVMLTAPTTGSGYDVQYSQVAFNVDLPRIEDDPHYGGSCNRDTGAGCTRIPLTDDGKPAAFYPYYTSGKALGGCAWTMGQSVPGFTTQDYGKNAEYGSILQLSYIGGPNGAVVKRFNDYQRVLPNNPCPRP